MAERQPTYIPINSNTRIQIGMLLTEASATVAALALAIEVLAIGNQFPPKLSEIAEHAAAAIADLYDRVQAFLDGEDGSDAP